MLDSLAGFAPWIRSLDSLAGFAGFARWIHWIHSLDSLAGFALSSLVSRSVSSLLLLSLLLDSLTDESVDTITNGDNSVVEDLHMENMERAEVDDDI